MRGIFLDTDTLLPEELDFSALSNSLADWTLYPTTTTERLAERLQNIEVVVSNKVVLDAVSIKKANNLKLICVCATGTNNVDLDVARDQGIPVCNVRDYAAASVAQHTLALMLGLATRWHEYAQDVRQGEWSRSTMFCLMHRPVIELSGKTLGIIGYGVLGKAVAKLARAFGMQVLIAESLSKVNHQTGRTQLDQLLAASDFVSLHCPLTDQSRNLIGKQQFFAMKETAFIINTARGGLINEQALVDALRNHVIAGAATDVLTQEPPTLDHPLLAVDIPNLIVTPHNAWVSRECRQRLLDGVVDNVVAWRDGRLQNCVNGLKAS